jgi:diaminopimelate epimerase
MSIRFTKMHGLGNDFMVIDGINQILDLKPTDIAQWSRRDTGIGFDQCLIIEKSQTPEVDFVYRIFNANGQEVGQCGNGARCLARFAHHYGLTDKHTLLVATRTTCMRLTINPDETVTVDMGRPSHHPKNIPMTVLTQAQTYTLDLDHHQPIKVHALSVGNPHAIIIVSDIAQLAVDEIGRSISQHALFPEQTNVEFMHIITPNHIRLRVYERGCGETRACGSGAVAAVVAGRLYHHLDAQVTVSLPGGELAVHWPDVNQSVFLTGPATFVYEGCLM